MSKWPSRKAAIKCATFLRAQAIQHTLLSFDVVLKLELFIFGQGQALPQDHKENNAENLPN